MSPVAPVAPAGPVAPSGSGIRARSRLVPASLKIVEPSGRSSAARGAFSDASAAGPASPHSSVAVAHAAPEPAIVVIVPLALTRRTRLDPVSAIRNPPTAPLGSTATDDGAFNDDNVAGP